MQDKIQEINDLNRRINSLKDLLYICQNGSGDSNYEDGKGGYKQDYFSELSLKSRTWTGTDNPTYCKEINNKDDIDLLVDFMIEPLSIQIKKLEDELANKLI